jgi:hypothetical protein
MTTAVVVAAKWVALKAFEVAIAAGATAETAVAVMTVAKVAAEVAITAAVSAAITATMTPKVGGDFGTQVDFKADPRGMLRSLAAAR